MDFCGPLDTGEYLFVIIDEYSRYPIVEIVKSVSANATIPVLDKVLGMFGIPTIIKSDNGSPFNSRITPRWPRANAQAEAINKPLMKTVRAARVEGKNWKQELFQFLRLYRTTPHVSTGFTPYSLMFAREAKTQLPQVGRKSTRTNISTDEQVRRNDSDAKYKWHDMLMPGTTHESDLSVEDTVLCKHDFKKNKMDTLYDPKPRVVTDKKGSIVTVSGNVTRNTSRFKKVNFTPTNVVENEEIMEDVLEEYSPDKQAKGQPETRQPNTPLPLPEPVIRSRRKRRTPVRFRDYVT
ncbi:uncharacterized protein [Argopecten irradians]|uniref:uncharacterized protein n=1 Tax=Argopecten irradians TaxID=31199 RepID=UPI003721230C